MHVTLIGAGAMKNTLTLEAKNTLERADAVIGARRLLDAVSLREEQRSYQLVRAEDIAAQLEREQGAEAVVLFSGDTGFYSGAASLVPLLEEKRIPFDILPGISSLQMLAARMRIPWQDWTLCSAHGESPDPVSVLMQGKSAFFLTGNTHTPATICRALSEAGLGFLRAVAAEHLYEEEERITEAAAEAVAKQTFAQPCVLWVEAAPVLRESGALLSDARFVRGKVPMTKQEVRAAVLTHLELKEDDRVWDVGAGTGSVSVAMAHAARKGCVYAIERNDEALSLTGQNRRALCAWNLRIVKGEAPEALRNLPAPDAVFAGGTGGFMKEVIAEVFAKNPRVRFVATAITMETLQKTCAALEEAGVNWEVTQIAVSKTSGTDKTHMMKANNPVFLIRACHGEEK